MSYSKQLQGQVDEYRATVKDGPINPYEIANWLIKKGWKPSEKDELSRMAGDITQAMRTQTEIDASGRKVRRKHVVKYKETNADGEKTQLFLWYDMEIAPPQFMFDSFQQRRGKIADACWQLKQDSDSYNEFHNKTIPIQVLMDFRDDMEERAMSTNYPTSEDDPGDEADL
jgi:hypothetical protein